MRPKTPTLTVSPRVATLEAGSNLTLTCVTPSVSSASRTIYNFWHDDKLCGSHVSGVHHIPEVTSPDDSGNYTCTASIKSHDSLHTGSHSVTVVGKSGSNKVGDQSIQYGF